MRLPQLFSFGALPVLGLSYHSLNHFERAAETLMMVEAKVVEEDAFEKLIRILNNFRKERKDPNYFEYSKAG